MTGKVDAGHPQAGPARDLEVDHREGDRDAGAAIEHLVQEAVARIVVLLAVAGEPLLVVEVLVEHADRVLTANAGPRHAAGRFVAHPLERIEVAVRVERRVFDPRDRQRRRRQILARRVHRLLELGGDLDAPRLKMQRVLHCGGLYPASRGALTA